MATMEVHFFSETLKRNVTFNAIIPVDKRSIDGNKVREPDSPMKTLYLLHGVYGDYTEWLNFTRVALWAQDMNVAVIMPSGENKFYCDIEDANDNFGKFVGEELVSFTRSLFHLSTAREDTYVARLSMGGLGALLTGLRYLGVGLHHIGGVSSRIGNGVVDPGLGDHMLPQIVGSHVNQLHCVQCGAPQVGSGGRMGRLSGKGIENAGIGQRRDRGKGSRVGVPGQTDVALVEATLPHHKGLSCPCFFGRTAVVDDSSFHGVLEQIVLYRHGCLHTASAEEVMSASMSGGTQGNGGGR